MSHGEQLRDDQTRFRCSVIARAFTQSIAVASNSPQSELTRPSDVSLAPGVAISDADDLCS